ncbi:MAG: hypothetical protein QXL78_06315 [Methanocellales archaeon]
MEDGIILEFLAEIPRALRPTLFYDIWLIVPKTTAGADNIKQLIKAMVEKVGVTPLNEEEWEDARPIREKLEGKLEVKGVLENLWRAL